MNSEELIMNNEEHAGAPFVGIPKRHDTTVPQKRDVSAHGITLISLIITIIIMLILAGVVLNLTIGERGIFNTASDARNKYLTAEEQEQKALEELDKKLGANADLPENTETTEAGTEVKVPLEWYSTTSAYVSTEDGSIVREMTKVATVTAIAVGSGETVPVPNGFYYVGGTKNSGVVISDDARDRNKYVGVENVPTGVKYNEDGTVKTYTDAEYENLSADEKKATLMGNQFVWIPVTINEYAKKDWEKDNKVWETQTNTAELPQIQKYSGFYVGRYEAGTSNITLSTGINFANANSQSDNFSIRDGLNHTVTGIITSKAGEIPYYNADYFTALKLSNDMYKTDYVQSGLITGTMWDVMMKFIADNNEDIVKSSAWGNYNDNTNIKYTKGIGRYAKVNSRNGALTTVFTVSDEEYYYGIKTTAISEDVKKKNLYDVAGNLWEWTQEASYGSGESYMRRGGSFDENYSSYPVCFRANLEGSTINSCVGFRPALYIK